MIQDLMNGGASVEDTLALWATSLRGAKQRIRPLFTQERVAASASRFLDTLLGNEPRKTGWMRAEAAGDSGPWRQQALLGGGRWDADALHDLVRNHVVEHLGEVDAVLVIDETGFLKQGRASCGVGRQYTDSAGKITNCQIGVFAATCPAKDMLSSTGRFTCRRLGRAIRRDAGPRMFPLNTPSPRSPALRPQC